MIRALLCLLALLALWAAPPAEAAGEPMIRLVLPPDASFPAGRQIRLEMQVLAPNYFLAAPQFPALAIPGAVVTLSGERTLNFTETIGGQVYAGIRRVYLIVPLQGGRFTLQDAQVPFSYAAVPGQATATSLAVPPLTFEAVLPPGAMGPNGPLPMAPLAITQEFDHDPAGLKAGDTLTRTVTITARGMPAMMIPPPDFPAPDGVTPYHHDPVLSDADGSGTADSRRVDRVTYAFTRPGNYALPAVEIAWFDVATGKAQTARAPGLALTILPGAPTRSGIAPDAPNPSPVQAWREKIDWAFWLPRAAAAVLLVMACGGAALVYGRRLRAWIVARRLSRRNSEAACFKRLIAACEAGEPKEVDRLIRQWTARAEIGSFAAWARTFGDTDLRREADRLERGLYSASPDQVGWNHGVMRAALTRARAAWLPRRRNRAPASLPALNAWNSAAPGAGGGPQRHHHREQAG